MSQNPWENPPDAEYWYAIRSYDAPSEEQLSAIVGEPMSLLDDADVEWWYCTNMRTQMSGYIPAMFIESTESRKARINTIRNKQMVLAHREDWKRRAPPGTPEAAAEAETKKKKKTVVWNTTVEFSDGTSRPVDKAGLPAPLAKRRSITNVLKRGGSDKNMDEMISALNIARDAAAAAEAKEKASGMMRIYANMWDLEMSYKAVVLKPETTTEELINIAYTKFNPNDTYVPNSYYIAFQHGDSSPKRLANDAHPLVDWNKLPDGERSKSKVLLVATKYDKKDASAAVRIYGDGVSFRTVPVQRGETVAQVTTRAIEKFKMTNEKPENFRIKDVIEGKGENVLPPTTNMLDYINSWQGNHRLYLDLNQAPVVADDRAPPAPEPASADTQADAQADAQAAEEEVDVRIPLRVYSSGLDLDVAYRTVHVAEDETVQTVTQHALERFGKPPSVKYHLEAVIQGQSIVLKDTDMLLSVLHDLEEKNQPHPFKLYIRDTAAEVKPKPVPTASAPQPGAAPVLSANSFSASAASSGPAPKLGAGMRASSMPMLNAPKPGAPMPQMNPNMMPLPPQMALARAVPPATVSILPTNPAAPIPEVVAPDALLVSKLPMRVYCDFITAKKGENDYKTVMVSDSTTASQVRREACEKFGLEGSDLAMTQLCVFADTLGTRVMDDSDCPLIIRNLHMESGHSNVKCVLRRGGVVLAGGKFPIRVHGDKVWANEAYKTVVADEHLTCADAIKLVLLKFKQGVGSSAEDFSLSLLDGNGVETLLKPADKIAAKHGQGCAYVLRRAQRGSTSSLVAARAVGEANLERRGSDASDSSDGRNDDDDDEPHAVESFSAAAFLSQQRSVPSANPSLLVSVGGGGGSMRISFSHKSRDAMTVFSEVQQDENTIQKIAEQSAGADA